MFKAASDLFGRLSPSKRKKARRDLSEDMFSDDEKEGEEAIATGTSFSAGDKEFLMEMTKVMAAHTENTVKPIRDSVEELRKENAALKQEVNALRAGVSAPDLDKIVDLVSAKLTIAPPPGLHARNDDSVSASQPSSSGNSLGDPLCWVMGALGKDLNREQAQDRARQVLALAGIEQTRILDLYAPYAFGSNCHVLVDSVSLGLQIQRQVRQLRKDFGYTNQEGDVSTVWFDRKRTKEERMPYLTLNALYKLCKSDLASDAHKVSDFVKCGASRHIYFQSRAQVVCNLSRANEVIWGAWSNQNYSSDVLEGVVHKLQASLR